MRWLLRSALFRADTAGAAAPGVVWDEIKQVPKDGGQGLLEGLADTGVSMAKGAAGLVVDTGAAVATTAAGFDIRPGEHPIVPVMLYDAKLANDVADAMLEEGIYVIGFFFPVVPRGEARIRVQISAANEKDHLDRAIEAFTKVGRDLGVLKN